MLASDELRDPGDSLSFSFASDIVELVIFTTDELFMQTLREAVGDARRLWHVPSTGKISDLLLAGQVGIVVLDIQPDHENAGSFVAHIKRQFPDLVVLVAGNRDMETTLAALVSDGTIYRFIHKPMSPGRAKLFADSAVKKYLERRTQGRSPTANAPATAAKRRGLIGAALGMVGVGALAALIAALSLRHGPTLQNKPPSGPIPIKTPSGNGDAAPAEAAEAREQLLAQAQNALVEERLDAAADAIDAASKAGADGQRVNFLASQLAKLREQHRISLRAKAVAHALEPGAGDARLQQLLSLAEQRIKEGRLVGPEQDSAWFYVSAALQLDPNGNAAQAAKETLARELLAQTREAINSRDFARADGLLNAADGIAAASNVQNARRLLRAAQSQADAEAGDHLLKMAEDRLQQDRLVEPPQDSAKFYLVTLRQANPGNGGLVAAMQDLGSRMVAKARRALELKQPDAARRWLDEADAIGFSSADASAVLQQLQADTERQSFLDTAIDASRLTLVKSVKPAYPAKAELAKTEGWVELDFTVAESGEVKNIAVHAANPPGVFDAAAIGALSHWRYQPVLHDDKPAAQRARIRMRFSLAG